jgi:myo-inositol-1(or 4)-monophosphatase
VRLLQEAATSYQGHVNDLKHLLAMAETAAAAAGQALAANRATWAVIEAEHGREVKISADKKAEEIILAALSEQSEFPIISEEAGWARAMQRGDRFVWAVDPLDGSVNYLRFYPHCGVSIALLDQGEPVLGVVDCFLTGERFTGAVGEGAWLNGAPMSVSEIDDPSGSFERKSSQPESARKLMINMFMLIYFMVFLQA